MAKGLIGPDGKLRLLTAMELAETDPAVVRDINYGQPPAVTASQVADLVQWIDDGLRLTAQYVVRDKTLVELAVEQDESDRQAALTVIPLLKSGSGTAGERIARLEKVAIALIRRALQ